MPGERVKIDVWDTVKQAAKLYVIFMLILAAIAACLWWGIFTYVFTD